jgi:hypothetical protein
MTTRSKPEAVRVPRVSLNCASGNHLRCLGTVYDLTAGLVKCACDAPDCGHGTDTAKARRARGDA